MSPLTVERSTDATMRHISPQEEKPKLCAKSSWKVWVRMVAGTAGYAAIP